MRRELAAAQTSDAGLMDQDIAARRHEAAAGEAWATVKDELATKGIKADEWCRKNLDVTARSMDRRLFLFKHWNLYETARRQQDDGLYGMVYAVALIRQVLAKNAMKSQPVSNRSATGSENPSPLDISRCDFRTGDALNVLRSLASESVNVCLTSPPYFNAVRDYSHDVQIGHEGHPAEYLGRLTSIFKEVKRVLRSDGVLWIVIGDAFAATSAAGQPRKNLLMIPAQLALALQADGWVLRSEIIWEKRSARPEAVTDRPTRSHETILMLSKAATGYSYNADALREPMTSKPHAPGDLFRAGVNRRETQADNLRVRGNAELGRNARSVWQIIPSHYRGSHPATFPPDLVWRCLKASCPPDGLVLDPFGGAATTALVALELGHRAITIDINPDYTAEGKERIANSKASPVEPERDHEIPKATDADQNEEPPPDRRPDFPSKVGAPLVAAALATGRESVTEDDREDALVWRHHAEKLAAELERVCTRYRCHSQVLLEFREAIGQVHAGLDDTAD